TKNSGAIDRYNFGYYDGPAIITLSSGAQIRNCTDADNTELLAASGELPWNELADADNGEPLVLIYHTHTSESFLPFGSSYDADYPIRSVDCERNITAVGDAICEALAQRGISSVHDCTSYDFPMYTGAYYRSAETLLDILEEYPSIKIAIDIHRDGLINADGTAIAPVAEINGKTAAQFMIITGCDSPETPIPNYMQNFKLACLLQNSAEKLYPTLARPILFDYRSYNQPLFEGNLLIEVGSQANTLDEAVYAGDLLGYSIAEAILN
ncbi:MAG: stage II sporulation protein P, partial [Oscillospiraceae bacterium]|nr:stage II sporulation protein P [Oscillospiraceae bacterium]